MSMDLARALTFAADHRRGVLVTLKGDGRPQLSNIFYVPGEHGTLRISVTDDRAKTRNLRRDPRASLHVTRDDFFAYAVLEGNVELSPVTTDPRDATADELVALYRDGQGEHPDWDEYRRAMVADHRLVATLRVTAAYGMLPD